MATSSNDDATQHWIFFAPSERGHLTPMLPLLAEIPRLETPKQCITVIIQPWYDGIFESCVQLIEEAARELRSASSQDDAPVEVHIRVVNLYDITSWRWTGEAYPVMNIPTALGTADDVVHYLRHLDPPPSAIVFDPFEPVAIIAARVLNLPLITSVSYTPYSGKTIERWWKNTGMFVVLFCFSSSSSSSAFSFLYFIHFFILFISLFFLIYFFLFFFFFFIYLFF